MKEGEYKKNKNEEKNVTEERNNQRIKRRKKTQKGNSVSKSGREWENKKDK